MKPQQQFKAVVEQQHTSKDGEANLFVVGSVAGSHSECWQQAKKMVTHPVITFTEIKDVYHGTQC